jgi:hypothetical protein
MDPADIQSLNGRKSSLGELRQVPEKRLTWEKRLGGHLMVKWRI